MKKCGLGILVAILLGSLSAEAQIERSTDFHSRYTLKEAVVLSRHNIRSPLSGPESALGRITPHEWFHWSSGKSELSLRGGVLETEMGQFFRKWLVSEGLMNENHLPAEGTMRFYANSMQRTIATAQYFSSGMLPVANVKIEHHYDLNTMDPVFTPQLTVVSEDYCARARQQIADIFGNGSLKGVGVKMADNYALLEKVLDVEQSTAWQAGEFTGFKTNDTEIILELNKEPGMGGSLKTACSASDALVLQYYEEPDEQKAAFNHDLTRGDWEKISAVKDYYGDILFTAPLVAVNVAHPLLQTILNELRTEGRQFTFLCGHDSNLGSVLAALGLTEYKLPEAIESKTPIGSKLVFEKWLGADGKEYVAMNLVYQSVDQLRQKPLLMLENRPMVFPISLEGLMANRDGLYLLSDLEARFEECIAAYYQLLTGINAEVAISRQEPCFLQLP
ncbi:MAG: histidine-type phosphatase [Prevotella sp.]|jgi:glucose-1-phosphatase|nr:histidine-type phosphatase [Prevotella sp.]